MLSFVLFVNGIIWLTLAGPRVGTWWQLRKLEPEDVKLEVTGYLVHGQDRVRGMYNLEDLVFNDLYEFKADISDKYCVRWQTDAQGNYTNIFRVTASPDGIVKKISPRRLVVYKRQRTLKDGWVQGDYVTTIWCRGLIDKHLKRLHDEKLFLHKLESGL